MTTPILHFPARSPAERPAYRLPSERMRPPFATAQLSSPGSRTVRTGACVGAGILGGIGLTVGCVVLAVSWLLAAEAHAGELLSAAEWAARVTTIGLAAGGIAGGVVGAFLAAAMRVMRRGR